MPTVFKIRVLLPFRAAGKWYDAKKGHTGVDLNYVNEDLPSPISGTVKRTAIQTQMGKVLYIEDAWKNIHVFAHLASFSVDKGDQVKRGDIIAQTDNTGAATTGPHLHYEIITEQPYAEGDDVMTRQLWNFKGYNTDPIPYLLALYKAYHVDPETGKQEG